jgi:hypothetical protein
MFSPSRWPDHEDVLWLDVGLQGLRLHAVSTPPVSECHSDGLLGIVLHVKQ